MADHLVLYRTDCPLRMQKRGRFDVEGVHVSVVDRWVTSEWSDRRIHAGLEFRVLLDAPDPRSALKGGRNPVEVVSNLLSVSHRVALEHAVPVVAMNIDPSNDDLPFAQPFFDLPAELLPIRPFSFEAMMLLVEGRNGVTGDVKPAVDRALWHLRKSAGLEDLVEQFYELWVGLEGVNGAIKSRHELARERPVRSCPSCGEPVILSPTSGGIKYAIETLAGYATADWRAVNKLRQLLLHGKPGFDAKQHDFPGLTDVLRHALVAALSDLMEISEAERDRLLRPTLRVPDLPNMLIWGRYKDLSRSDLEGATELPLLKLTGVVPPGEDGEFLVVRTEEGMRLQIEPPDPDPGCQLEGAEFARYEDPEKLEET